MNRILMFLLVFMAVSLQAKESEFPSKIKAGENDVLEFSGKGPLSKWFIKGCEIGLYVPDGTKKSSVLDDIPRCLEFHYFYNIKAGQFATAAWKTLKKNWSAADLKRNKSGIDKIHGIYRDVKKGDSYRLLYLPGKGTTLYLNGKDIGTVKGGEFSKVYYSIWLGKKPIDKGLKNKLIQGLQ